MEISPVLQARLLLVCIISGVALGALCDALLSLGRALEFKWAYRIARFLCDLLAPTLGGVILVLACYYFSNGEIRAFAAAGLLGGFFVYRAVASRAFSAVLLHLLSTFFLIIRRILLPIFKMFKYLVNILRKTVYYISKTIAKFTILVYNIRVKKSVLKRAEKGFLHIRKK